MSDDTSPFAPTDSAESDFARDREALRQVEEGYSGGGPLPDEVGPGGPTSDEMKDGLDPIVADRVDDPQMADE